MEVIIPAAGLSTRFPGHKPKYILNDFNEKSMLFKAIQPYIGKYNITIGILNEHDALFQIKDFIKQKFGSKVNLVVLPERTKGPADTVSQILDHAKINPSSPILIKDCDSFFDFDHESLTGNYVCISHVEDSEVIYKLYNKSFVIENENGLIQKIVEKQVISGTYCVGGYRFERADLFQNAYKKISSLSTNTEIFVSHIIKSLMTDGHYFFTTKVRNYTDVGTLEDWLRYNNTPINIHHINPVDDLYKKLSLISLEIENNLLEKPYIWTNNVMAKTLITWKNIDEKLYDRIYHITKDFRGDEILLDVFDTGWIAGHPRAITKWAGSLFKLQDVEPARSLQHPIEDIPRLIWWANRLNLKVHVL